MRLGSFQNLYLSFAIVEITHGVTANRDDTDFHHAKPQILDLFLVYWKFVHWKFVQRECKYMNTLHSGLLYSN